MFAKHSDRRLSDQDLHAFVDGELEARRYREVVQQLATDPGAAERLGGFLRQHGELALLREHLDEVRVDRDGPLAELGGALAGRIRRHRRVRLCSAASGALLAALVGSWTAWGPDPGLMAQRLAFAANGGPQMLFGRDPFGGAPQLVGGEAAAGGTLLDQQLAAYSVRRPDFAAHGLTFVGGNALKGGSAPAIRLVYKDGGGRLIYLFVGTVGGEADVALTLVPEGHVSLNWRRGDLVLALIGPKESQQMLELMRSTGEFLVPAPSLRPDLPAVAEADAAPVVLAPAAQAGGGAVTHANTAAPSPPTPAAAPLPSRGGAAAAGPSLGITDPASTPLPVTPAATGGDERPKSL